MSKVKELAGFIWSVADEILRDSYKRSKYADVIYPFTVIRRLDCILEPTQKEVINKYMDVGMAMNQILVYFLVVHKNGKLLLHQQRKSIKFLCWKYGRSGDNFTFE
ncbi:hypothetical protein D9V86_03385 [Bacteroidetes/Chlorobi group bacterium ChocPot_Mid]|nr:MAG: hypothetical protein D9V86_03385 [Bacteroidetes/Chlorobi group bacterium ChocPot_Mid]